MVKDNMKPSEILRRRLHNQQIPGSKMSSIPALVDYMGAMQSQDWNMAKWAIGLRLPHVSEADIEEAFNAGKILRTHVLRPTWHFVSPENIRWMLELTAPHVQKLNKYTYNKFSLGAPLLKRSADIICRSLEDNNFLTRENLQEILKQKKIRSEGIPLSGIVMHAELEGLICSGPRKKKQITYALMSERVKAVKSISREEALAKMAELFFGTRGPATVQDMSYWSGLTIANCTTGAATLDKSFEHVRLDGQMFYFREGMVKSLTPACFLMPDYDEYGMSYKNKHALLGRLEKLPVLAGPMISHMLVIDGKFGGFWTRAVKGNKPIIETKFLEKLSSAAEERVKKAVDKYLKFFKADKS